MNTTDPIADYLTRLRNAIRARHKRVDIPASRMKRALSKILAEQKFISGFFGISREVYVKKFKIISDPVDPHVPINFPILNVSDLKNISNWNDQEIKSYFDQNQIINHLRYHIPRAQESDQIAKKLFESKTIEKGLINEFHSNILLNKATKNKSVYDFGKYQPIFDGIKFIIEDN